MIDELIRQLQDSDPEVRKRAITTLGKAKVSDALKPLAAIMRSDPDPEVRELARKAGQYIYQQSKQSNQTPLTASPKAKNESYLDLPNTEDLLKSRGQRRAPDAPDTADLIRPRSERRTEEDVPRTDDLLPNTEDLLKAREDLPHTDDLLRTREDLPPTDDSRRSHSLYMEDSKPSRPAALKNLAETAANQGLIIKGRQYNVAKTEQDRAKQYLDAALSLNINGDNARAMKNLTEAISLNPNLINDGYFNNVAASVTGLDGDEAARMIIDRNERKRFTEGATLEQKNRRIEKHMTEAKESTWADVWFEVGLYTLIVIIGPVLAMLVMGEAAKNLLANYAQVSKQLPEQLQNAQAVFNSISLGSLLPIGIISGVSGVVSLLFQTVIIHYLSKALGGVGTWRHLIEVLLSFYNKWFPRLFFLSYITITVAFVSLFSPIALCPMIILVILLLYVTGQTSSKVGNAYDFGGAKGCITVILSSLVILVLNLVLSFVVVQIMGATFGKIAGGV